jgi:hypothetical protein
MEPSKCKLTKTELASFAAAGAVVEKAPGEQLFLIKFAYDSVAWDVFCERNSDDANAPDPMVACIVMPPAAFIGTVFAPAPALYGPIQVREGLIDVTQFALGTIWHAFLQIEANSIRDHYGMRRYWLLTLLVGCR